jgi:hypothetical protein
VCVDRGIQFELRGSAAEKPNEFPSPHGFACAED